MASEAVERARRFYPAGERVDIAELLRREDAVERLESRFGDIFHEDFETVDVSGTLVLDETGMSGFVKGWREWLSSFESWAVAAEGFEQSGDRVLVLLDIVARTKTGLVEVPSHAANVLTFRDGKVAAVELHTDVAEARRAAGVEG